MNNRVQPDSTASRLVEPRASDARVSSRPASIDALFAQALASVAATFAPASTPTLNGIPTASNATAPTGRSEAKRKLTEPESREATRSPADDRPHNPAVLDVSTPMSAAQHARQELRRASDSGAANDAPTLSDPADADSVEERSSPDMRAAKATTTQTQGGRDESRATDQADPRQEAGRATSAARSSNSACPNAASNRSGDQHASNPTSGSQMSATVPVVSPTNATTARAGGQVAATSAKIDAPAGAASGSASGSASGAASGKADPMAALGARSSRVRFTAELPANQAAPRSASLPDQVARGLATLLRHQGGRVTIRLTPETLGQIKINLKIEDARVWATFQPSSDASRDAINQSLASLRASLESRGLVVERLEVVPTDLANFGHSLRDSNHQAHSPDGRGQPSDPNATGSPSGSHSGAQSGDGGAGQGFGTHRSPGTSADGEQAQASDTELLPDSLGSAVIFMDESPSESGMARRLRLDAVA
ncbi:MAG: flagellar hook-length control protein FliK [Phycisphaerales bacterium]|nr:flagellar hook-length control protein FliK [Phycisphaerales bacterium]